MWKEARIVEAGFLSKGMVLMTMAPDDGGKGVAATCEIPWVVRMVRDLRDLGLVDLDVPVRVDLGSGKEIKELRIRMGEEFRLRDILLVLDVMGS